MSCSLRPPFRHSRGVPKQPFTALAVGTKCLLKSLHGTTMERSRRILAVSKRLLVFTGVSLLLSSVLLPAIPGVVVLLRMRNHRWFIGKWGGAASQRQAWKLPHYANRGKTTSSGGELASARSCFSTVRTALGKLRITGLLAQFDVARSFPQFPRPLLLQPTILTSERGTRFGIRKAPNHVPTSPFTG